MTGISHDNYYPKIVGFLPLTHPLCLGVLVGRRLLDAVPVGLLVLRIAHAVCETPLRHAADMRRKCPPGCGWCGSAIARTNTSVSGMIGNA